MPFVLAIALFSSPATKLECAERSEDYDICAENTKKDETSGVGNLELNVHIARPGHLPRKDGRKQKRINIGASFHELAAPLLA